LLPKSLQTPLRKLTTLPDLVIRFRAPVKEQGNRGKEKEMEGKGTGGLAQGL